MDLIDVIQQKKFLGNEFLTWLWFQSEQNGGTYALSEDETITFWIDDRLELSSNDPSDQRNVLRGGTPALSPEAKAALQQERKASQAKFRLSKGEREWVFVIDGSNLDLRSVKLPALLTSEEDDRFYERVHLLEELKECIETLFSKFITVRSGPNWPAERLAMSHWMHLPAGQTS